MSWQRVRNDVTFVLVCATPWQMERCNFNNVWSFCGPITFSAAPHHSQVRLDGLTKFDYDSASSSLQLISLYRRT